MQQLKIFKSIESEIPAFQDEINEWLAESCGTVISMTGNISPQASAGSALGSGTFSGSDVILFVLYEPK